MARLTLYFPKNRSHFIDVSRYFNDDFIPEPYGGEFERSVLELHSWRIHQMKSLIGQTIIDEAWQIPRAVQMKSVIVKSQTHKLDGAFATDTDPLVVIDEDGTLPPDHPNRVMVHMKWKDGMEKSRAVDSRRFLLSGTTIVERLLLSDQMYKRSFDYIVGQTIKNSGGKANPKMVVEVLKKSLMKRIFAE